MLVELALLAMMAGGPKPAPCSHIAWRAGVEQRVHLLRCLSNRAFPKVSFSTAYQVAQCESGVNLDPKAVLGTSQGLWQHQRHLWRARAIRYLKPRWGLNPLTVTPFNAYAATIVTYSMASDKHIGWEPWSCSR